MTAPDNSVVSMITRKEIEPDKFEADDRMQREAKECMAAFQHAGDLAGVMMIAVYADGNFVPSLVYGEYILPYTTAHGALDLSKEFYRNLLVDRAPDCPGGETPDAA